MKVLQFLQEQNGQLSSKRLFSFLIVLAVTTDYMHAVWTVGSWHPDLALIGILITVIGGQVAGGFSEDKTVVPPVQP